MIVEITTANPQVIVNLSLFTQMEEKIRALELERFHLRTNDPGEVARLKNLVREYQDLVQLLTSEIEQLKSAKPFWKLIL